MTSTASDPPVLRATERLGPDRWGRFIALSLALHFLWALPWALILTALLKALGLQTGPVHWKEVDAPTVIPIDLDLEEADQAAAPEPGPPTQPGPGPGPAPAQDAGPQQTDAAPPLEASTDSGSDAHGQDGGADGGDAGDAGPERVKDPNALAGGLNALKPPNKEVHVSVLVRMDHLRLHPIGKQLGGRLTKIAQWKPFFDGTGLDPVRDFDVLYAFGPRFYETSRVSAIVATNKPDEAISLALQSVYKRFPGAEWIGDDDVPAFRAKIDGADRVIVQLPGGIIITPPDGEKQSIDLARQLVKKKKRVGDTLPKGDADLILSSFLTKPSNVLTAIPEDLHDVHITLRTRKDMGGIVDLDAKAKDAKTAAADAEAIKKLIEGYVPKGFIGAIARKYVDGYTVTPEGDVVHVHHELDGDRVDSAWTLLTAGGL
ncbi:MAG: hypothetical protein ACXWUG_26015 [Polyangiales bacterium]